MREAASKEAVRPARRRAFQSHCENGRGAGFERPRPHRRLSKGPEPPPYRMSPSSPTQHARHARSVRTRRVGSGLTRLGDTQDVDHRDEVAPEARVRLRRPRQQRAGVVPDGRERKSGRPRARRPRRLAGHPVLRPVVVVQSALGPVPQVAAELVLCRTVDADTSAGSSLPLSSDVPEYHKRLCYPAYRNKESGTTRTCFAVDTLRDLSRWNAGQIWRDRLAGKRRCGKNLPFPFGEFIKSRSRLLVECKFSCVGG